MTDRIDRYYLQGIQHFNDGTLDEAVKALLAASGEARRGDVLYALAVTCELAGLSDEYESFMTEAASIGYPAAVGECILDKLGSGFTTEQALGFIKESAQAGDVVAQGSYAMHHLNGQHIERDTVTALEWASRGARQGNRLLAQIAAQLKSTPG